MTQTRIESAASQAADEKDHSQVKAKVLPAATKDHTVEVEAKVVSANPTLDHARSPGPSIAAPAKRGHFHIFPMLLTLATLVIAAILTSAMWKSYIGTPWTRDGTVRAYVVTIVSEVAGRIIDLPIADNQVVHKNDLLMLIDPTDYKIAVSLAEATVQQAQINSENAKRQAARRRALTSLAVTREEQQTYKATALSTQAQYQQAVARLDKARVDLDRTRIVSPVDGFVTNLLTRPGDYATAGDKIISLVDVNSDWIDGYFEETNLGSIHEGAPAIIKLMGFSQTIRGHVSSIARGITVANAQPSAGGLASVNPIFTWVRLAQRVPVHIDIDQVPHGIRLVAGTTATVQLERIAKPPAN